MWREKSFEMDFYILTSATSRSFQNDFNYLLMMMMRRNRTTCECRKKSYLIAHTLNMVLDLFLCTCTPLKIEQIRRFGVEKIGGSDRRWRLRSTDKSHEKFNDLTRCMAATWNITQSSTKAFIYCRWKVHKWNMNFNSNLRFFVFICTNQCTISIQLPPPCPSHSAAWDIAV